MQAQLLHQHILEQLPQTQCKRCGYEDCEAYARSIAEDNTPINQCPPGGQEGVVRLARVTQRPALPLNEDFGVEGPRKMAFIDEQWCIGCTLCLDACPTDAIIGTHKSMHTVIESCCTGCELCVPVCPIDCIELEDATPQRSGWHAWSAEQAQQAQQRYAQHKKRLDDKALRGPKTHTQAKRLHALEASPFNANPASQPGVHTQGPVQVQSQVQFQVKALEVPSAASSNGPQGEAIMNSSTAANNASPAIDKAALLQKALDRALQRQQPPKHSP